MVAVIAVNIILHMEYLLGLTVLLAIAARVLTGDARRRIHQEGMELYDRIERGGEVTEEEYETFCDRHKAETDAAYEKAKKRLTEGE